MSRPSSLNDLTSQAVLAAIQAGATWTDAATAAGVDASTVRRWKARGREDDDAGTASEYRAFYAAATRAEAECIVAMTALVVAAAATDWRAAAWLLERRRAEDYGRRDYLRAEHSGPNGAPIAHATSDTWRQALTERLDYLLSLAEGHSSDGG